MNTVSTLWLTTALAAMMALASPALAQQAPAPAPAAPAATDAAAPAPETAPTGSEDDDDGNDQDDDGDNTPGAPPAAAPAATAVQHYDYGPSGIMVRSNREDLAPLTLASGKPVADQEYTLKSGGYYRIKIVSDGSQELALSGGDFFRAIWVNEIVINDIELRPMGVHSLEFDDAGEAEMSFVAILPGRYTLSIPGSSGASQQAVFTIQ